MLTLKVITQETEKVLKGLEKKHFKNAKETIDKVLEYDKIRRASQGELDATLQQSKQLAAKIGQLMKEKNLAEAEQVKQQVAELKEKTKNLQAAMDEAAAKTRLGLLGSPSKRKDLRQEILDVDLAIEDALSKSSKPAELKRLIQG